MRSLAVLAVALLLLVAGCAAPEFVRTGPTLPALSPTAKVEVFMGKGPAYKEIGLVSLPYNLSPLESDKIAQATEDVKSHARMYGCDCALLKGRSTGHRAVTYHFILGKLAAPDESVKGAYCVGCGAGLAAEDDFCRACSRKR